MCLCYNTDVAVFDYYVCLFVIKPLLKRDFFCWCGSVVEQLIRNQQVVGSIPTTSSNDYRIKYGRTGFVRILFVILLFRSGRAHESQVSMSRLSVWLQIS